MHEIMSHEHSPSIEFADVDGDGVRELELSEGSLMELSLLSEIVHHGSQIANFAEPCASLYGTA